MKSARVVVLRGLAALGLSALVACGGGGSNDVAQPQSSTPSSSTPAPVAVTSAGVITGFGSVYVNGARYDTSEAEVEFEDAGVRTEDDLRLGMRIRIEGTREGESRRAERIHVDDDLRGPVTAVAPDADAPGLGTFTVARQLATVDGNTVFDDDIGDANQDGTIDLRDLDPAFGNVVVKVSGFPTASGLLATRVERANPAGSGGPNEAEVEVKGFVGELDEMGGTFVIRDLAVRYGQDDLDTEDFPDGRLSGDLFVEVKGNLLADGTLDAVRIEREDDLAENHEPEDEFEIEGVLQAIDTESSPNTVTINGMTIAVGDASPLAGSEGRQVEIKGSFDDDGVLVLAADDSGVNFKREDTVRIEDRVETVGTGSFFTRLGLEITPTGNSRIEDSLLDDGDRLTPAGFLSRIANGDYIEARGFPADTGSSVTWTRIERDKDNEVGCRLRGPVHADSNEDPFFTIQGVTVDTGRITSNGGFRDANDAAIGREAFFRQLSAGAIVQVRSVDASEGCSDGLLIAEEVEFELDYGPAGGNPRAPGGDNGGEISGTVTNVNDGNNTFLVAGRTVSVTADTLIDASIVEAARGVELPPNDLRFGDLPESLSELLPQGTVATVTVDSQGNAILIED